MFMNFQYHPTMCSHAFIVTSQGCRCMIISIYESASHDKKSWPKSIFLHFFCFKWKKPRINNGVINNVFKRCPLLPTSEYGRSPFITIFILLFFWDFLFFFSWDFFLGPLLFFAIISSKEKAVLYIKSTYENCLAIHLERTVQLKCLSEMRAARFILVNSRSCPEFDRVFCVISKYRKLCKVFYKLNLIYKRLSCRSIWNVYIEYEMFKCTWHSKKIKFKFSKTLFRN